MDHEDKVALLDLQHPPTQTQLTLMRIIDWEIDGVPAWRASKPIHNSFASGPHCPATQVLRNMVANAMPASVHILELFLLPDSIRAVFLGCPTMDISGESLAALQTPGDLIALLRTRARLELTPHMRPHRTKPTAKPY